MCPAHVQVAILNRKVGCQRELFARPTLLNSIPARHVQSMKIIIIIIIMIIIIIVIIIIILIIIVMIMWCCCSALSSSCC